MTHFFIALGSLLALIGVVARSLSSHTLLELLEARGTLGNYNLAADYLLFHGLALLGIAILCHLSPKANTIWQVGPFCSAPSFSRALS